MKKFDILLRERDVEDRRSVTTVSADLFYVADGNLVFEVTTEGDKVLQSGGFFVPKRQELVATFAAGEWAWVKEVK